MLRYIFIRYTDAFEILNYANCIIYLVNIYLTFILGMEGRKCWHCLTRVPNHLLHLPTSNIYILKQT